MKLNISKLIAGAIVAGIVFNLIDYCTNTYWLKNDFRAMAGAHNIDPGAAETGTAIAKFVCIDIAYGFLALFTYAAIRPRFGAGPATAVIAALIMWISADLVVYMFQTQQIFTMTYFVKGSAAALLSSVVGTLAGASVYRE
jgi:hypothetical protein